MTCFQIIKKHKNMIGGIAIALVILMCMPFFTTYAIDTMSDWRSNDSAKLYTVTTVVTTSNYKKFSKSMANTVAVFHGFENAEAFKAAHYIGSNGNMGYDVTTGNIVILMNNGAVVSTEYNGGWK